MATREAAPVAAVSRFELWFVAQVTMGIVYIGGAMFLLPQFVLSLEGSNPGDVGIVMAVLCGFAKFLFCFDLADREDTCPIHRAV